MPAAPAGSGLYLSVGSTDTAATTHPAGVSDTGNSTTVSDEGARNPVGDTHEFRGLTASEGPSATGTLSAGGRPSPTRDASATVRLLAGGGPPASGCPSVGAISSA